MPAIRPTAPTAEAGERLPARPPVVTLEQWLQAREDLLREEKGDDPGAGRARRAAAEAADDPAGPRAGYRFTAPDRRPAGLLDVFDGCHQLVVYHFMQAPGQDHLCGRTNSPRCWSRSPGHDKAGGQSSE